MVATAQVRAATVETDHGSRRRCQGCPARDRQERRCSHSSYRRHGGSPCAACRAWWWPGPCCMRARRCFAPAPACCSMGGWCWASLWMGTCEVADDTDGDHRWCAGTLSPSDPLFTGPDAMLRINSRAGGLAGHAPTPVAPSRRGPRGGTLLACEERPVIVVLDEQDARRQLDAGRLACPPTRCGAGCAAHGGVRRRCAY